MRTRGLLDLSVTLLTCSTVYTQTPIGGAIDATIGFVTGSKEAARPLTSFFDLGGGDGPTDRELAIILDARRKRSPQTIADAAAFGVPYELLRALELAAGETGVRLETAEWTRARELVGADRISSGRRHANAAAALLIHDVGERLGSIDAGLEALRIGEYAVLRAINLASDRGVERPARYHGHERYLTRAERERAEPFVRQVMAIHTALTFVWPVSREHRVTSGFGPRRDPMLGDRRFHNGVDLGVPAGTPVHAAHDGTVLYSTYDGVNGRYAKLDHGYGLTTAYCHNAEVHVNAGDKPDRGDVIASSGNTGRSTGPHLHYIVRIGGKPVDPVLFR